MTSEIASWAKIAEENKTSITATAAAMDELRKKSSHDQNELLSRTAQLEATIKDMQKTADAAIASVQQALKSARDEGLAKSFQNRSKKLRGERLIWSVLFIAAVAGLAWASIALARELLTLSYETLIVTVLRKAAIAGPAIWLGWYSARQVGRTARIQEDYEYKAASALAYQSYKEEAQRLGDSELIKDLLKTAISTFGQNPVRLYDHAQGDPVTPMDALTKKLTPEQLTAVAGLLSSFPTQKK